MAGRWRAGAGWGGVHQCDRGGMSALITGALTADKTKRSRQAWDVQLQLTGGAVPV